MIFNATHSSGWTSLTWNESEHCIGSPMSSFRITVETRSEPDSVSIPVLFILRGRTFRITDILDSWHGTDHAYFKLVTDNGIRYVIRHDLNEDTWELILMEAGSIA